MSLAETVRKIANGTEYVNLFQQQNAFVSAAACSKYVATHDDV
jgi:hypothetical protein